MKTTRKNKVQALKYAAPDLNVLMSKITFDVILASEGQIGDPDFDVGLDTIDFQGDLT
ncbi:MAG: hypothetical protein IJQ66_02575 [Clostridia bacterium]|nr:hypothetical protein [Clostridia bacterium]